LDLRTDKGKHIFLLIMAIITLIWSFINTDDLFGWFMLSLPAVTFVVCLILTYKKFQFTNLTYLMVFFHVVILLIGAKYTYTHNPLFFKIQEMFNLSRNHYDRVGHLAQGFVPVLLTKEILFRNDFFKQSKFFYLILFFIILGISACWELLEFLTILVSRKAPQYILGSQGDMWDAQWDMIMAIIGGLSSILIFGKLHNREIDEIEKKRQKNKSIELGNGDGDN